ncbi:hypothetical protein Tco_1226270 [Tanacetum coccineum]
MDNTSDTSYHMDVNGLEKEDISVDDNLDDDLNDLNDKLNELAQATKDDKIHFECPNATNLCDNPYFQSLRKSLSLNLELSR